MIKRIKEYKSKINDTSNKNAEWDKVMLLDSIADYIISQHEEKEKNNKYSCETLNINGQSYEELMEIACKTEQMLIENKMLYDNDPVVEVGQIWRNKATGKNYKIVNFNDASKTVSFGDHYEETLYEHLEMYYELVTMENIKPGEWVECIKENIYLEVGDKRIVKVDNGSCYCELTNGRYADFSVSGFFKPCLPPLEEETKINPDLFNPKKHIEGFKKAFEEKNEASGVNGALLEKKHYTQEKLMYNAYEIYDLYTRDKLYTQDQLDEAVKKAREEAFEEWRRILVSMEIEDMKKCNSEKLSKVAKACE